MSTKEMAKNVIDGLPDEADMDDMDDIIHALLTFLTCFHMSFRPTGGI
jgi:hypothetical protein